MGAIGTMNVTRTLRATPAPDGAVAGIAAKGLVVEKLEEKDEFSRVRLVDVPGKPEGWVSTAAITIGDPAPIVIDKADFVRTCWQEGAFIGTSPHYIAAIAEVRSRVSNSDADGYKGLFRLRPEEWSSPAWKSEEFKFKFEAADISDWRKQTTMFALMTLRTVVELTSAPFNKKPTVLELYIAQIFGAAAAAKLEKAAADQALDKALVDGDLPAGAQTLSDVIKRHGSLLKDGNAIATVGKAREQITAALQSALDSMRPLILQVGPDVLEATPTSALGGVSDAAATPPANAGELLSTLAKAQEAFTRLKAAGWTAAQACGIVANIKAESSFNFKDNSGDSGTAAGLCQWRGPRQALFQAKFDRPIQDSTFEQQLDFITFELRKGDSLEQKAGKDLDTKTTPGDAAESFCRLYERPLNPDNDSKERRKYADSYARLLR
jgi:hypothetical protein